MVLTIALFLPSCTHKPYHPTKNDREWTIDHEICERWAREGIRDDPDTYDQYDLWVNPGANDQDNPDASAIGLPENWDGLTIAITQIGMRAFDQTTHSLGVH